jgi:hypothetical protein
MSKKCVCTMETSSSQILLRVFPLLTLRAFFSMRSEPCVLAALFPLCFLIVSPLVGPTLRCHASIIPSYFFWRIAYKSSVIMIGQLVGGPSYREAKGGTLRPGRVGERWDKFRGSRVWLLSSATRSRPLPLLRVR